MARTSTHRLISVVVTVIVSSSLYWLVGNLGLAIATGVTWGISLLLILRMSRQYPSHTTGNTWADKRWTGLGTGLLTLAATVGVSSSLPISGNLRLALGFLVIGAGTVGYTTATMAEIERKQES